jgi:hypothetical protein
MPSTICRLTPPRTMRGSRQRARIEAAAGMALGSLGALPEDLTRLASRPLGSAARSRRWARRTARSPGRPAWWPACRKRRLRIRDVRALISNVGSEAVVTVRSDVLLAFKPSQDGREPIPSDVVRRCRSPPRLVQRLEANLVVQALLLIERPAGQSRDGSPPLLVQPVLPSAVRRQRPQHGHRYRCWLNAR